MLVAHIMFKTAKDANENQINEAYQKAGYDGFIIDKMN